MKAVLFAACLALLLSADAPAGDYFVYRDGGKTVLSNIQPSQSASIVKAYQWQDVTDEEVARAERRSDLFWLGLKAEQLAESNDRLAAVIAEQSGRPPVVQPIEITVGATAEAQLPAPKHHHGKR